MKFKVDQFWWTRDRIHLMKIIKIDQYIHADDIRGNHQMLYYQNGQNSVLGLSHRDLVEQETDNHKIAKYLWREKT